MSYGITNFAWIWLLCDRDGQAVEWSLLPILGWITVGRLCNNFGAGFAEISYTYYIHKFVTARWREDLTRV